MVRAVPGLPVLPVERGAPGVRGHVPRGGGADGRFGDLGVQRGGGPAGHLRAAEPRPGEQRGVRDRRVADRRPEAGAAARAGARPAGTPGPRARRARRRAAGAPGAGRGHGGAGPGPVPGPGRAAAVRHRHAGRGMVRRRPARRARRAVAARHPRRGRAPVPGRRPRRPDRGGSPAGAGGPGRHLAVAHPAGGRGGRAGRRGRGPPRRGVRAVHRRRFGRQGARLADPAAHRRDARPGRRFVDQPGPADRRPGHRPVRGRARRGDDRPAAAAG